MNTTTKTNPRRLDVRWVDHSAIPLRVGRRKPRPVSCRHPFRGVRRSHSKLLGDFSRRAFTLLELMVVLGIIGFLAALALPHVSGYNRANGISAATRQLLDDAAFGRQRAIANRSTVYMVFVQPGFYTNNNLAPDQAFQQSAESGQYEQQITNLLSHQYTSYALLTLRTVGDQPGRHFPHYLTDWRILPQGVFIAPYQFNSNNPAIEIVTTNTLSGTTNANEVYPFNWINVPFPSISYGATMAMPYIAFTPEGTLTPSTNQAQYIMLARGSIFYPQNTNGVSQYDAPMLAETPPGNESNNPCLIEIDTLTARPSIVQNQFQ